MRQFDSRVEEERMSFFKQMQDALRMMNDMHMMKKIFSRSFQHLRSKYQDNID